MDRVVDEPRFRERIRVFEDRFHAGRLLAKMLQRHVQLEDALLFAIPAGGVPVGYVISGELHLPMDVIIVRKIQVPWDPEAGFGAISWDGEVVLNEYLVKHLGLTHDIIQESIEKTMEVIRERFRKFRAERPMPIVRDRTAILVDDGLASGYTMLAAVKSMKKRKPKKIVVAVPTASMNAVELLSKEIDDLLCLNIRSGLIFAVADAYKNWRDLTDQEVMKLLKKT